MDISCQVKRVLSKNPASINPVVLKFEKKHPPTRAEREAHKKTQLELAKARWFAVTGYDPKKDNGRRT